MAVWQDEVGPVLWGGKSDGKVRVFKGGADSDSSTVDEAEEYTYYYWQFIDIYIIQKWGQNLKIK